MWFAILITVVAASGNNVGKALQKEAVHNLPRFSLHPGVFRQYLRSRLWTLGLAADLSGALLMIAAFALAPVSLVQPVSGVGLVSLAVVSHFRLKERLALEEWGAVAMATLGTVGLGVSSEDVPADQEPAAAVGTSRLVIVAAFVLAALGALLYGRRLTALLKGRKSVLDTRAAASVKGLQAGVCFGLSAASCKTGILLLKRAGWTALPLGLAGSVLMSSLGFMLQTLGLKDGNTVIVCTCAAVSSMGTGVLVGVMAMGEPLPSSFNMKLLRLLSWLVTMAGVSVLANGKGGFREVARLATSLLPRRMQLYARLASAGRKQGDPKDMELPTTGPDCNI